MKIKSQKEVQSNIVFDVASLLESAAKMKDEYLERKAIHVALHALRKLQQELEHEVLSLISKKVSQ